MKYKIIKVAIFLLTSSIMLLHAEIPTTNSNQAVLTSERQDSTSRPHYQQFQPFFFSPQAPGYNTPDDDPKFHGVKPIPFKPEDLSTGKLTAEDNNRIGYFWNIKETDPSLIYPGKARIANDQFINVVAVDTNRVDHTGEADFFSFTDVENIYDPSTAQQKNFHDDFLVKIGSFLHNGKIYDLYGQYLASVVPDPEGIEYT